MILFVILFSLIVAVFLLPSLLSKQEKQLQSVEDSLANRMEQLKIEFQFRTKELAKRLENGDLDQEEWQKLTNELQIDTQNSIESTKLAAKGSKSQKSWAVAIVVMIVTMVLGFGNYWLTGTHKDADLQAQVIELLKNDPKGIDKLAHQSGATVSEEQLSKLYLAMREKVELYPNDTDSWRELARFNLHYGRDEEAYRAIELAQALEPDNIDIQVDKAQIMAGSQDKMNNLKAFQLLKQIVKQNPEHETAKVMLGFSAFSFENYQLAIDTWNEVLENYPADSKGAMVLTKNIEMAKQRMSGLPVAQNVPFAGHPPIDADASGAQSAETSNQTPGNQPTEQGASVESGKQITVEVQIPDAIRAQLSGGEMLFVYATATNGMKFPLAVVKTSVRDIPDRVVLSDQQAMQEQFKLSNFDQVKVIARISKNGSATSQAGDIQGQSEPINAPFPEKAITIVIDQTI